MASVNPVREGAEVGEEEEDEARQDLLRLDSRNTSPSPITLTSSAGPIQGLTLTSPVLTVTLAACPDAQARQDFLWLDMLETLDGRVSLGEFLAGLLE